MFSVENLTKIMAEKISSELKLDNDRKEVIAYGFFALLNTLSSIALVAIFGLIFGVLIEALIISFTGAILRKYSGGAHASSPWACTLIGTIITIGEALLISFIISPLINLKLIIFLGVIVFICSYYIIIKLAPVDSAAKPIRTQKKKDRMKKGSILILDVYVIVVILNFILYLFTQENRFLVFTLCIYGGTLWQVFTLTRGGHLTVYKIDAFLDQILIFKRRRK